MKHSQYSAHFWARSPEMLCSLSAREAAPISPAVFHLEFSEFMARSEFRNRFEAKGRLRPYLEAVPSYVIVHPAAAFLGLKSLSDL